MPESTESNLSWPLPPKQKLCWILLWEFAKITAVVIGGGYVILSVVEAEFVRKRGWMKQQDFLDMVALAQTVPGIIACNGAIYLGFRLAGFAGAVSALVGTVLPPFFAIVLIATGVSQLPQDNVWINGAFVGVNSCIVGMIFATAWRLGRKTLTGFFEWLTALAVFFGMIVFHANPGWLMLAVIPCGIFYVWLQMRRMRRVRAAGGGGQ